MSQARERDPAKMGENQQQDAMGGGEPAPEAWQPQFR